MILKSEAIVLKTMDYRNTSMIATFFTKDFGKVRGVLKGIRKDPKKFGSHLDKFTVNDIVYYQHRNSDLHLISQCDLTEFYFAIRNDLKRTMAANYALELIDKIMPVEEKNVKVYGLLKKYFKTLEDVGDVNKLVHILQIKIILLSGFKPYLDACLQCKKKITQKAHFSMHLGGLFCSACVSHEVKGTPISQGTVASLLHIEKGGWQDCMRISLTRQVKKEMKYILNNFLVFHLERNVKTAKYL